MKTRIITGIVAIALFVPICVFSNYVVFPIAIAALSVVGIYEMAKCLGMDKKWALTVPMYLVALALPFIGYYEFFKNTRIRGSLFLGVSMLLLFFVLIYTLAYVMFRKNQDKISDILAFYALFLYIVGCFNSIICLRYMTGGKYVYLLVFIGAWVCDTFAYFTGRFLGKHKLIPEISPKKTIEGSIGGIVFTIGAFILYRFILFKIFPELNINLPYWLVIVLGIAASIVSQIGDLVASAVKRQYDIKDYGKLFPGHGGVLDRFDSVMLVAPVIYVIFIVSAVIL